ncbi:MAG: hypothetical protein KAR21_06530 [Spirochaetales bacterium]|nr:hypothetical protein [Spirochaetales bacterium]
MKFNPLNMIIGLVVGWFVISFLQALVISVFNSDSGTAIELFKNIATFKNKTGVIINFVMIVVLGSIGTWLFFLKK